jgi:hypothetical protein
MASLFRFITTSGQWPQRPDSLSSKSWHYGSLNCQSGHPSNWKYSENHSLIHEISVNYMMLWLRSRLHSPRLANNSDLIASYALFNPHIANFSVNKWSLWERSWIVIKGMSVESHAKFSCLTTLGPKCFMNHGCLHESWMLMEVFTLQWFINYFP